MRDARCEMRSRGEREGDMPLLVGVGECGVVVVVVVVVLVDGRTRVNLSSGAYICKRER